jgi:hypothetical protein
MLLLTIAPQTSLLLKKVMKAGKPVTVDTIDGQ